MRHACLFRCRLLQRGLHDAVCLLVSCLLVFVLHAFSCLSRNLPRGQGGWLDQPQPEQPQPSARRSGPSNRRLGPPFNCLPCLGFWPAGMIVCRGSLACGGRHLTPTGSGDLTVASCMTPKVRSLDGVVCVLLCAPLRGA